ncbi:MAG: hypothetical protein LBI05_04775 [Planctomycetaceae bacterium]|nr:hypothetical protein [Planctomycetaceae bacterium]
MRARWNTTGLQGYFLNIKSGIDKTDWFKIDKKLYDAAIDSYNYRKQIDG